MATKKQTDYRCKFCLDDTRGKEGRVYFGVVGPFCSVDHREEWLKANPTQAGPCCVKCGGLKGAHRDNCPDRKPEPTPGVSREMRIGASLVVRLIRTDYLTDGIDKAIKTGRACFDNGDGTYGLTDAQIIAIARDEATLRGWSPPGVDYLDEPCKTCRGKGRVHDEVASALNLSRPGSICPTCEGDCFHPPIAESRAKYAADVEALKGSAIAERKES